MTNLAFAQPSLHQQHRYEAGEGSVGGPPEADGSIVPPRLDRPARDYEEAGEEAAAPVIGSAAEDEEGAAAPRLEPLMDERAAANEAAEANLGDVHAESDERIGPVDPRRHRGRFAIAIAAAVLLHAGIVAALLTFVHVAPIEVPSREIPVQIIVEAPPAVEQPATPPAAAPPPAEVTPPPVAEAPPPPVETSPPPVEAPPPPVETPPPAETPPPPVAVAPPPVETPPPPVAEPKQPPQPDVRQIEQARREVEARQAEARRVEQARQQAEQQRIAAQRQADAEKRRAEQEVRRQQAQARQAQAQQARQASAAATTDYRNEIFARILRNEHYPETARERGVQGMAIVSFTLDAGGGVADARVARSSGSPVLDAEAVAMVRRSAPFPAPPPGSPRTFSEPISFRLN